MPAPPTPLPPPFAAVLEAFRTEQQTPTPEEVETVQQVLNFPFVEWLGIT